MNEPDKTLLIYRSAWARLAVAPAAGALGAVLLVSAGGTGLLAVVLGVGLGGALVWVCFGVALDRAGRDLRFLYVLPLLPSFSVMMGLATLAALVAEARGTPKHWNKLARTGVVSRR